MTFKELVSSYKLSRYFKKIFSKVKKNQILVDILIINLHL